jgi:hypothetical protein
MELDKFVETDEKVRTEINRKQYVEYLKGKNQEELQHLSTKIKSSVSPKKISEGSYVSHSVMTYTKK